MNNQHQFTPAFFSEETVYRSLSVEALSATSTPTEWVYTAPAKKYDIDTPLSSLDIKLLHMPCTLKRCYTTNKFLSDDFLSRVPEAVYEANQYRQMINMPLFIRSQ